MTIIKLKRGTAAEWLAINPVLEEGEEGYEEDTDRRKIGDGETNWSNLPYQISKDQVVPVIPGTIDMKVLPFVDPNMARPANTPSHVRYDWEGPGTVSPPNRINGDRWTQLP